MVEEPPKLDDGWKVLALKWSFQQGPNFVLLAGVLVVVTYFTNYVITKAFPDHTKQVQEGYEKIEDAHKEQLDRIIAIKFGEDE